MTKLLSSCIRTAAPQSVEGGRRLLYPDNECNTLKSKGRDELLARRRRRRWLRRIKISDSGGKVIEFEVRLKKLSIASPTCFKF